MQSPTRKSRFSLKSLNFLTTIIAFCILLASGSALASESASQNPQAQGKTEVMTVSLQEAKRLWDLGAVFIDVRSDDEWNLGRIKNARHVNFRRNFAKLKTLDGITRETPLVFYCSMPECKIGPYATAVSMQWGFESVFYFPRGYFAWMMQDYPIDMSPAVSTFAGDVIHIRKADPGR